jgi:hypothetical protein
MKSKLFVGIFAAALMFGFQGCKPEKKELGPKSSHLAGIKGKWVLTRTDQIDVNVQLAFTESDTLLNVSDVLLTSTPMEINFDKNSFAFNTTTGDGSDMFGASSGTWKFDNNDYPSYVIFNEGAAGQMNVKLIRPVRLQDRYLILKINKFKGGKRTVCYHLWFERKN